MIVKLSAIGDVIHTLPSLSALRKLYPLSHITWVVEEAAADIVNGHPDVDETLVFRRKRWICFLGRGRQLRTCLREMRAFLKSLRSRDYDLVIDFHGLFKSALVVFLSRGKRRLGYDSMQELSGFFLNEKVHEDMKKHAVERYLDLVNHLGAPESEPEFFIATGREDEKRTDLLLESFGLADDEPFIAVNPVAFWETKLWADEKFARLCDRLRRELKYKVVFTGGSSDGSIAHIQSFMLQPSINLGGRTSLKDLACIFRRAALLVTTDSGPMHLAAAVKTPVVALFGPTSPARTGPYGAGHTVIRTDISCSPCYRKKCNSKECMEKISDETVFQAVKTNLRREDKT